MKEGFTINYINCASCGNMTIPPVVMFADNKEEIKEMGISEHKKSVIVCRNPKVVISYSPAFASNSLLQKEDRILTSKIKL